MLVIRADQMAAFGASIRRRFEDEMASHLATFFPELCPANREGLGALIRRNIDKALAYGIERELDVCKFLDLTMALGENFDQEIDWARHVLHDPSIVGQDKIDRLVSAALDGDAGSGDLHG
jgi:hypothetical protein